MAFTPIPFPIPANATRVILKSGKSNRNITSCKQKFLTQPIARFAQLRERAASMFRRSTSVASGRQDNQGRQNSSQEIQELQEIQETFVQNVSYTCPTGAWIFSGSDIDYDKQENLLQNPLKGQIDLKLDPNSRIPGCISVLEAIQADKIRVDFYTIIYRFVVKMLNPYHYHYPKYVEAMGLPNLNLGIRDDD
jgi:hypothetical protein